MSNNGLSEFWRANEARLRGLAAAGLSAAEIGEQLGVTRNAVIGFCSRRGIALNGRGRPRSRKSPAAKPAAPAPTRAAPGRKTEQHKRAGRRGPKNKKDVRACANPAAGRGPVRSQMEGPVPFMSIGPGLCRFPLWGFERIPIEEKLCCGAPAVPGTSWCEACAERVLPTPAQARRANRRSAA